MMIEPAQDKIVQKLGGDPYAATVLISKRAKEIEQTKKAYVNCENVNKPIPIACEEVFANKITINDYKAKSKNNK